MSAVPALPPPSSPSRASDEPVAFFPLTGLSDELLFEVLGHVPPLDVLRSVSLTNRRLASLTTTWDGDARFWRSHPSLPERARRRVRGDGGPRQHDRPLSQRQLQALCCCCRRCDQEEGLPRPLRAASVLPHRESAMEAYEAYAEAAFADIDAPSGNARIVPRGRSCLATTTDHRNEILENVLRPSTTASGLAFSEDWAGVVRSSNHPDLGPPPPTEFVPTIQFVMAAMTQNGTYWSSAPSRASGRDETSETLIFATSCADVLVRDAAIKPFRELRFEGDHQPYTWPAAVVRVYSLPVGPGRGPDGGGGAAYWEDGTVVGPPDATVGPTAGGERCGKEDVLAGHEPVYESEVREAPPPDDCRWQHFVLPRGVVGNVVTFTLLGKNFRQFPQSGYYTCVDRVAVRGVPL